MNFQPKPFLTLAFACSLLLAGCELPATGMKAKQDPVSLQKKEETGAVKPPVETDSDKIAKLQQQVASLQQEVIAARPKIAKIDVMEKKFKDLSLGLDKIDATYNMKPVPAAPAPVVPAPAPTVSAPPIAPTPIVNLPLPTPAPVAEKPVAPKEVAPPKPPEVKAEAPKPATVAPAPVVGKIVKDLRIGEQKGYSRLVLDLGESVKINYDIDNDEKILVVDIPGFAWKGPKSKTFAKSLLIASYQAESDDKGSRLVVQLRQAAKISNYSTIEATAGKSPRAVLDVAPQ